MSVGHHKGMAKSRAEHNNMSYPNILERSPVLVHEYLIYLVQGVQTLHHMTKHRMLPVEVFDVVRKCNEELTSAATGGLAFYGGCNGHRNGTFRRVLQAWYDFRNEITWHVPSPRL